MSSHYIYLSCRTPQCSSYESIYTGEAYTELFDDSGPESFEGEVIELTCKLCQAANLQLADYEPGVHRSDCGLHNAPAMAPRVCDCGVVVAS